MDLSKEGDFSSAILGLCGSALMWFTIFCAIKICYQIKVIHCKSRYLKFVNNLF
jgi:hypothetical protein